MNVALALSQDWDDDTEVDIETQVVEVAPPLQMLRRRAPTRPYFFPPKRVEIVIE